MGFFLPEVALIAWSVMTVSSKMHLQPHANLALLEVTAIIYWVSLPKDALIISSAKEETLLIHLALLGATLALSANLAFSVRQEDTVSVDR
jgi:hypothetical protein